jgi:hypothetical protein
LKFGLVKVGFWNGLGIQMSGLQTFTVFDSKKNTSVVRKKSCHTFSKTNLKSFCIKYKVKTFENNFTSHAIGKKCRRNSPKIGYQQWLSW